MQLTCETGITNRRADHSRPGAHTQGFRFSCSRTVQPFSCRQRLSRQLTSTCAVAEEEETKQSAGADDERDDEELPGQSPDEIADVVQKGKYAVIEIGGVQMFVQEGRWYNCNRLEAEPGQTIQLGRVLAVKQNGSFKIGQPYLEQAIVKAEIVEDLKGPKLTIFKMNRKKHYRRKTGHRQPLTQFYVKEITVQ